MEQSGENNPDDTLEEGELSAPPKRQPISLEELLERKAQKEKEESRPLYISKEERAQQALEKRKRVSDCTFYMCYAVMWCCRRLRKCVRN